MANQPTNVSISTTTILKVVLIGLALWFLATISQVLVIVFVALVLAAAIDPWITRLERMGMARGWAMAIIFVGAIALLSLIVILFVPLVVDQLGKFTQAFPKLYERVFSLYQNNQDSVALETIQKGLQNLNSALSDVTKGIFSSVFGFFGGLISVIGVLVLTFYLTLEEKGMKRIAIDLAPAKYRPYLIQLFNRIEDRLGDWLRGQLILGLIIGSLTLVGLLLLKVEYAVVLALIAGVTELIPIIGPFIGAIPAVIVAFSQDPILAVFVIGLYIVIQQLENNLIVPRVISKATGLNPVIVIVAILVGGKIAGITGVILAVPTMIIITTFLEDFLEEKKADDLRLEPPPKG